MSSTFSLHIVDGAGREWKGPGVYEREVKAGKVVRRAPECMRVRVKQGKWSGGGGKRLERMKRELERMKRGIIVRKRHFYKGVGLVLPKFCVFLKFG